MLTFPNDYCPYVPTDKQREFLALECLEAFYGGAAGGGKSVALLMGALKYVDVPGYAALILRKDTQRLSLAGGLIPRSHEWLAKAAAEKKARWNEARRTWTFPNDKGPPATLTFGYLNHPGVKFRYQSSEYQYIAFDELTELAEADYLYLFSRLRKAKSLSVPLRIRSASNPGNIGHAWVKQRFIGEWLPGEPLPEGMTEENGVLKYQGRAFLPSLVTDNRFLEADEYRTSLMHLPPIERERLLSGDWSIEQLGVFRREWLRYYLKCSEQLELFDEHKRLQVAIPMSECRTFITVDPAGTSEDREHDERVGSRSYSVVQVWQQPQRPAWSHLLVFRDQLREQVEIDGVVKMIQGACKTWKPDRVWIEDEKLGHAIKSSLQKATPRIDAELIRTENREKKIRAVTLANKMERGEVFLPENDFRWRPSFEHELLAWTGHRRQRCDQIDAAAYAAIISQTAAPGILAIEHIHRS